MTHDENLKAIKAVLSQEGLVLVFAKIGSMKPFREENFTTRPFYTRDMLAALLDGIPEAEAEAWVLWCFGQEKPRHQLRGLRASRGRVYVE